MKNTLTGILWVLVYLLLALIARFKPVAAPLGSTP
jgi:hypothetical protein